jgi:hypothetical protein
LAPATFPEAPSPAHGRCSRANFEPKAEAPRVKCVLSPDERTTTCCRR